MSAQLLRFALGRALEHCDEPTVQSISAAVVQSGFPARTLVEEIVCRYPFRYRCDPARESDIIPLSLRDEMADWQADSIIVGESTAVCIRVLIRVALKHERTSR